MTYLTTSHSIEVKGKVTKEFEEIITPDALDFISRLETEFRFISF